MLDTPQRDQLLSFWICSCYILSWIRFLRYTLQCICWCRSAYCYISIAMFFLKLTKVNIKWRINKIQRNKNKFVCHSYVTHIYPDVIRMSLVCHSYVTRMSLIYTCMSLLYHSYVLICHSYVTRMYSDVTCMCFYHEPYFKRSHVHYVFIIMW